MYHRFKLFGYRWLKRSEKITKTDMIYLAKGHFWLIVGQILSSISAFLLSIAFANLLPKEIYGSYKYVLSIAGVLSVFTLTGMSAAISQAAARGYEGGLIKALKTKIKFGLLGSVGSLGVSLYYYLNAKTELAVAFLIVAAFIPLMDSFALYSAYLHGKKLFKNATIFLTSNRILAALTIGLTIFFTKNLAVILFVYFFSWTLLRLISWLQTVKKFAPNDKSDPETISYGKHSSFVNITASLIGSLDMILLFHYLGASGVAIYSFSLSPISQIKNIFNKIPTLAMPKLATRPLNEIQATLARRTFYLFLFGSLISGLYILAAPYIFRLFYPQYLGSVLPSQIWSISLVLALSMAILGPLINSRLTTIPKKLLHLWNIPSIVLIVSIIFTIKPLGVVGMTISQLLSSLSAIGVSLFIWKKIKKIEKERGIDLSSASVGDSRDDL